MRLRADSPRVSDNYQTLLVGVFYLGDVDTTAPTPERPTTPATGRSARGFAARQAGGWSADVGLVAVERLRAHPFAARVPAMGEAERALLGEDISRRGIVTPLEVTDQDLVLDGRERLAVACELGLAAVPVRRVTPVDVADYILCAALARRNLSASQKAALAVECAAFQRSRKEGVAHRRANLRQVTDVATLPHRGQRTREAAAARAGVSARLIQDAACIRDEDPALHEEVLAGRIVVSKAARQVRRARRYAEIPAAPPLPEGPFQVILADPPWQIGSPDSPYAPENHYPTMPLADIEALEVPSADDAVLFLWVVNILLPEALGVMAAWGYTYVGNLVWVKPSIGLGNRVRYRHELVLLGTRGSFPVPEPADRPDSVIEAARRAHSEKPEALHERIERAHPHATKCELFARGVPRSGWVAWGNEVIAA